MATSTVMDAQPIRAVTPEESQRLLFTLIYNYPNFSNSNWSPGSVRLDLQAEEAIPTANVISVTVKHFVRDIGRG